MTRIRLGVRVRTPVLGCSRDRTAWAPPAVERRTRSKIDLQSSPDVCSSCRMLLFAESTRRTMTRSNTMRGADAAQAGPALAIQPTQNTAFLDPLFGGRLRSHRSNICSLRPPCRASFTRCRSYFASNPDNRVFSPQLLPVRTPHRSEEATPNRRLCTLARQCTLKLSVAFKDQPLYSPSWGEPDPAVRSCMQASYHEGSRSTV